MYHLTVTKSKARLPEEYEPLLAVRNEEIVNLTEGAVPMSLTTQTSHALTPQALRGRGRLLLGVEDPSSGFDGASSVQEIGRALGKFIERGSTLFTIIEKNGLQIECRLANMVMVPVEWHRHITLHGAKMHLYGHVKTGERVFDFSVLENEIPRFFKIMQEQHPTIILDSACRNAEKIFQEYVSASIEAAGNLETREIYKFSGWGKDFLYHSGAQKNCISSRILPDITGMDINTIFQNGVRFLDIGNIEVTLPVFLQMAVGVMAKLFEDAGMPVQYLLCLAGPSGSKKTSVSKAAFCIFDINDVINFTSTDRALELHAEACHDWVMVLDDLASVKDKESLRKLNTFLRQICDSSGRKKSVNGGHHIETVSTRTSVVVTAESVIEDLQQSGLLRLVQVPVRKDSIRNEALAFFQHDQSLARLEGRGSIVELFVTGFIHFLEKNYKDVLRFLTSYQPPTFSLEADRYNRVYRILSATCQTIFQWGISCRALSELQINGLESSWLGTIQNILRFNDDLGKVHDPVKTFLQVIVEGVSYQKIALADSKEKFSMNPIGYIGFKEGSFVYLDPSRMYQFVTQNCQTRFSATMNDVASRLRDLGVSQGYTQKGHKAKMYKSLRINGENVKMLCIDWQSSREYLEKN